MISKIQATTKLGHKFNIEYIIPTIKFLYNLDTKKLYLNHNSYIDIPIIYFENLQLEKSDLIDYIEIYTEKSCMKFDIIDVPQILKDFIRYYLPQNFVELKEWN